MPEGTACTDCGTQNAPEARFCMHCGVRLTAAAAPILTTTGERRQLTVMFCDLVDSTVISGRMDPEEYRDLIVACQQTIQQLVERYSGHIAQFLGDGVLVYFGYPQALENGAEAAVQAGLQVLAAFAEDPPRNPTDIDVAFRIGIHTGDVVISPTGDGKGELAVGNTTNIAARIEGTATANGMAISDACRRLLSSRVRLESIGQPSLKGVDEPVTVYRVLGRDGDADRAVAATLPSVGREAELEQLSNLLAQARGGRGTIVRISGEPGIGKSHLAEAGARVAEAEGMQLLRLQCTQFATQSPMAPISDWLTRQLAQAPDARTEAARADFEATVAEFSLSDPESAALFARLIGWDWQTPALVEESAERIRARTRRSISEVVQAMARNQPALLLIEDLHWCDPTTLEWLTELSTFVSDWPVVVLLTHRPEFLPTWDAALESPAIELARLTNQQTRLLVEAAGRRMLEPLIEQIIARAEGVPLFAEELSRAIESGALGPTNQVPMSLKDSLMARLDRLGSARSLAQTASAFGREFNLDLLERCVGTIVRPDLDKLLAADLVMEVEAVPGLYLFKHVLLQEIAYDSILRQDRRRLHDRIARIMADEFSDRIEQRPEEYGRHLAAADRPLDAGRAYDQAGRRAALRAAFHEASTHYETAAALFAAAEDAAAEELRVQIQLGNAIMAAHGYAAEATVPVWERAAALAEQTGDAVELSSALNGSAVFALLQGDVDEASSLSEQILAIAEREDSRIARLRGKCTLAQHEFYIGNPVQAADHATDALAEYREGDYLEVTYGIGTDQAVIAHAFGAFANHWTGRFASSFAAARTAVDQALAIGSPISHSMALTMQSLMHGFGGDQTQALAVANVLIQEAEELRFAYYRGFGLVLRAMARLRGNFDRDGVMDELLEGVGLLGRAGGQGGAAMVMGFLGEAYWLVGDTDNAAAFLAAGLTSAAETGQHYYDSEILRLQGEMARSEDPGAAAALYRQALADAQARGARGVAIRPALPLAELLEADGEKAAARSLLADCLAGIEDPSATVASARAARKVAALAD